jgi:hypothetical protein
MPPQATTLRPYTVIRNPGMVRNHFQKPFRPITNDFVQGNLGGGTYPFAYFTYVSRRDRHIVCESQPTWPELRNGCRTASSLLSVKRDVTWSIPEPASLPSLSLLWWSASWRDSIDRLSSVSAGKGSTPILPEEPLRLLTGRSLLPWLLRRYSLCLLSSQPSEPNDPLLMSTSDGAFDAALPVAAHIPAGGSASMSFMLAVRMILDAVEVLVGIRGRFVVFWSSLGASGCGNGIEVATAAGDVDPGFGEAMVVASER